MRVAVIGDVHGCIDELKELVARIQALPGPTRIISAGDLLDRGPDPIGVVRFFQENNFECVLGNHEEKHRRYMDWTARCKVTHKKHPMRPFPPKVAEEHSRLTENDHAWLKRLPAFIRFRSGDREFIVTHAGIPFNLPIELQASDPEMEKTLVRTQHVDPVTGDYLSTGDPREIPEGSVYWADVWPGPESVIFGHHIFFHETPDGLVMEEEPKIISCFPEKNVYCYGVDQGCVHGGRLTAALIEHGNVWFEQVQAAQAYFGKRTPNHRKDMKLV